MESRKALPRAAAIAQAADRIASNQKHVELRNKIALVVLLVILLFIAAAELASGASNIDIPTAVAALFG